MKFRLAIVVTGISLIAGTLLIASSKSVHAQSQMDSSAFVGRWQINLSKTTLNRNGPNGKYTPRGATYTQTFTAQGHDLQLDAFNQFPQATPNRSIPIIMDGKLHTCTGPCAAAGGATANASVETYTFFPIDSHLMVKLSYQNGKINEYTSYALSTDGKTMSQITWSPQTPEWQSDFVFDKQ